MAMSVERPRLQIRDGVSTTRVPGTKPSIYLVIKRFEMDDVPYRLCRNYEHAAMLARSVIDSNDQNASKEDQELIGSDIGSELVSVSIVGFDKKGVPICSVLLNSPESK